MLDLKVENMSKDEHKTSDKLDGVIEENYKENVNKILFKIAGDNTKELN